MKRVTVDDVPSWAYRGLELFMLVPAVFMGLFGLGTVAFFVVGFGGGSSTGPAGASAATGTTGAMGGGVSAMLGGVAVVWILLLLFGLLSAVAIPVFLYLDAGKVADQDVEWDPSPVVYAVAGFFLSGLVVWHYLYKRHQYVIDWVGSEAWWYLALVGAAIEIGGLVAAGLNPPFFLLSVIGVPFVALGVYKDATYARLNSDWRPNPVNHFLAAFFSGIITVVGVLYFGYYAYKRHQSLGLV